MKVRRTASHVLLLVPPLFDCRAPQLACALLCGALRSRGYLVEVRDLNLEGVLWLLEPRGVRQAMETATERLNTLLKRAGAVRRSEGGLPPDERYALWRSINALRHRHMDMNHGVTAVDKLRQESTFFDPAKHMAARATVDAVLDLQAFACDERLHVGLCPQHYHGPFRATSLNDLFTATGDVGGNLFLPFYKERVLPWSIECKPLVVGISISNVFQVIPGLTLARLLHDHGIFVVIGGAFFSKFPAEIAARPSFFDLCDAVAIGDGEPTLLHLVRVMEQGGDLSRVPNLLFRRDSRVSAAPIRFARHLPAFGGTDFSSFPLEKYLTPAPVLPIHAGKGCNWSRCTFCEIPQVNSDFGRLRRNRHPREVVDDIQAQLERHAASHFIFTDESLPAGLLSRMADDIISRKLEVNYLGYTRFSRTLDRKLLDKLARSGCRKLLFGLESGSRHVNDECRKGVDLRRVPFIVNACQEAGIAVHVFSIVGLPGEDMERARESFLYLQRLSRSLDFPTSTMDVSAFYLNWNSQLRRNCEAKGLSYQTDQDFPLHVDDYAFPTGMDHASAKVEASRIYEELCWESSELGFDIGYANPVWPGWEEYTLLYLSRYQGEERRRHFMWPTSRRDVLEKVVRPADGLSSCEIPFSLDALARGTCEGPPCAILLSPSSEVVEVDPGVMELIAGRSEVKVADIFASLAGSAHPGTEDIRSYAQVARFLKSGVLRW